MIDGLDKLVVIMEQELNGIKENLVKGLYSDIRTYDGVLGEAKILNKMLKEAEQIRARLIKEEDDDGDGD